jgi:Uma2 family endonuclease
MSSAILPAGSESSEVPGLSADWPYRFSVEQFHRMIEGGVFGEGDRVELLEGLVLRKVTHNPAHDMVISLLQEQLTPLLPMGWILRIQSAVTLADSEPEPDLALVRGPARRYGESHPTPREIALLIEVADSTLAYDREQKGRVYARARIPVYWIVNIPEARVEVSTQPRAGKSPKYRQRTDHANEDRIPLVLEQTELGQVVARELLP